MVTLSNILNTMSDKSPEAKGFVNTAWKFSEKAHVGQKRLSGEAYISHPAKVAFYLAELGMDKKTIVAGLLHDTLEDTSITEEDLEMQFGSDVKNLVEGVTRLGALKFSGSKQYTENLKRLFIATAQDIRTIIIKLVDRLHNIETLEYHNKERQKRKALETLEIYAPVAERLGMSVLRKELEDLSFPFINPNKFEKIRELQTETFKHDKKQIQSILKEIIQEFKNHKLNIHTETRFKGIYSLYKKLERKDNDLDQINDLFTISVIVQTSTECYEALGIIHNKWTPLPGELKDFIAFPKPNGYQAIHTTIFREDGKAIEIQISTEEMNLRAKYGIVYFFSQETLRKKLNKELKTKPFFSIKQSLLFLADLFKNDNNVDKENADYKVPPWLHGMVSTQEKITKPSEFIKSLEADFFEHRIFVFNSEGDVIDLPVDSSPIDFAYALGESTGNHLDSSKVNHRNAYFKTKLKNGDIVELNTKPEAHPTKNWLKYVKTSKAKQSINAFLKPHHKFRIGP